MSFSGMSLWPRRGGGLDRRSSVPAVVQLMRWSSQKRKTSSPSRYLQPALGRFPTHYLCFFPNSRYLPYVHIKALAAKHLSQQAGHSLRFGWQPRSEEHTSELQSRGHLVCRLLLEKKKI